jgi:four helix bundle protein
MKTSNGKMQSERNSLSERLLNFAAAIIKIVVLVNRTAVGRHIGGQLTRSAASAGANYEEACGAESRADFIHKLQIVLKELRESLFWLRLIGKTSLISATALEKLIEEANQLTNIIAKSIVTAKKRK